MTLIASTHEDFYGKCKASVWGKEARSCNAAPYSFEFINKPEKNMPVLCQGISWAHDGTSIVALHDDFGIRQYLMPQDKGSHLSPFQRIFKSQSIISHSVHPRHSLFAMESGCKSILVSSNDMPLQMYSLDPEKEYKSVMRFNSICTENERYLIAYAIDFHSDNHFLAGSTRNNVSLYDVSRRDPIWASHSMRRGCNKAKHKTIVCCFDEITERRDNIRYAGTYKSEFIRIDPRTCEICTWKSFKGNGQGIYQIIQSENGHYIYFLKRHSETIQVVDVRNSMKVINELTLPFKIKKQKFQASYNPIHGLMLGNENGNFLRWERDIIEFGGIDRTGSVNTHDLMPEKILDLGIDGGRVNIIQHNPCDCNILAISYTPDKFNNSDIHPKSGIVLIEL